MTNLVSKKIITKLTSNYYNPVWKKRLPAMEELIFTVLTQHTSDKNAEKAFNNLMSKLKNFETILETKESTISSLIHMGGLANIKSKRILSILREIKEKTGNLKIDFLSSMSPEDAREWLVSLNGVGLKTASCVLAFSFGFPVIPVDTHIHRVSKRIGLINKNISPDKAHKILESIISPENRYKFHVLLINHGRNQCHARKPICKTCSIVEICQFGSSTTNI
jgi:endonuclease-3|tara:strand:+ start:2044 stop:2709 length:666 start_codon:yes stop_codon:yes gene_type:complete